MTSDLPTPIPVGSSLVANRPHFDRWGIERGGTHRLDKRDYERRSLMRDVWLIDTKNQTVLRCHTNDISDAGMHATAPVGFGMAVGQRYELRVANSEIGLGLSPHRSKSLGYGTVIRTEMRVCHETGDRVGFAVRFDVPQLIDV